MQVITTDRIVIVGAGMGALYAALKLAPLPVVMISPEPLGEGASSAWAQGGVAAAMDADDSPENHAVDTERAGAGTVDRNVASMVTREARAHILDLTRLGTPFDRTETGEYVLSREAAHSFARVVRVKGDQAGAEIMAALIEQVRATPSIQVLEGTMAVDLQVEQGRVTGVMITESDESRSAPILLKGAAHLLAGGGSGGLYALTTNPPRIRGQVIGMAARAGARIDDAEFVQFHPTAMDVGEDPAPLATEALRGEGAVLINKHGKRFMLDVHPDAELAPRDVVARAIFAEVQAGNRPMLDTREALGQGILTQFPSVAEYCARNGIDPVSQPIPVAPAAHYHMGGIATDTKGRASIGGLWVCGEASSTGLHGANRLASNGLLEALVYARLCAGDISEAVGKQQDAPEIVLKFQGSGQAPDAQAVAQLRQTMTEHVGVVRHEAGLKTALVTLARLEAEQAQSLAFMNMSATATLIAAAALERRESRGAHERSDYPEPVAGLGLRSSMILTQALEIRAKVCEEIQ
ncbi:L-aspartate oxidase [Aliiroseovarius sp. xm-m-379]|uniref:L-aspartate oxidase n=1 Tax=unclassified Aliiroseovarius TaxID=2623558 RepID=UPI001567F3D4|nr:MULTISPECIES: L-aspartate oxidase [unclassified Aliiroseovarius]NRP11457.1 L-aspartate oxidase [Aliiroseovarius sp. xm-d-517]NRP23950.1 L-aspartate oxidase [Aliiroseovarius sp. xm-m-379]NRP28803.1 L-aspartate oxidase [Aliiroseovarius sp. xm-m-314]NRP32749.1 L-aspartate oxidase [Aliiroseovarius sp. xm-a-104]NRP42305.1 L-aspartate oxidase [Aliiroseovarius sp. xm-m-339-2]